VELNPVGGLVTAFYGLPNSPYTRMNDVFVDGTNVWYAATSAATNTASIGVLDRPAVQATLWELPPDCQEPSAIWVEPGSRAVWFCCVNWNPTAGAGTFLGRLDVAAGSVDLWSIPGRAPVCFDVAAQPSGAPNAVWFTYYDWPSLAVTPNASRLFRFELASSTFFEYAAPTLSQPGRLGIDGAGDAWMGDINMIRTVGSTANCGVATFRHTKATVTSTQTTPRAKEERVKPTVSPSTRSTAGIAGTPENCFVNFPTAPASPAALAVDQPASSQASPRIYFTDPIGNSIALLVP
jgi:hypothetical protein